MANALSDRSAMRISHGSPYDPRNLERVWQGTRDAYINAIQAAPEWLVTQMAPQDPYQPGVLQSGPRDKIRELEMKRLQDIEARKAAYGRDYEQGLDYGLGLSMVADPYIDLGLGAIPAIGKALKTSAGPRSARPFNALADLARNERGAVVARGGDDVYRELEAARSELIANPNSREAFRNRNRLQHEYDAILSEQRAAQALIEPEPVAEDYRMAHTAPQAEVGASGDNLENIYPEDIYGPMGAQYYGHYGQNNPMDMESVSKIRQMKGKPEKPVYIYRAVPKDKGIKDINVGDWVTINEKYAKEHGVSQFGKDYKILKKRVKAKDIYTNGDSIHEWGYVPE